MQNANQRYVDVAGAAQFLGRTEVAIRRLVAKRQIPFIKVGRSLSFDLRTLVMWMSRQAVKTADEALSALERPRDFRKSNAYVSESPTRRPCQKGRR